MVPIYLFHAVLPWIFNFLKIEYLQSTIKKSAIKWGTSVVSSQRGCGCCSWVQPFFSSTWELTLFLRIFLYDSKLVIIYPGFMFWLETPQSREEGSRKAAFLKTLFLCHNENFYMEDHKEVLFYLKKNSAFIAKLLISTEN